MEGEEEGKKSSPPVMAQVISCRSLKRSRSSHLLSSYSAAESRLLPSQPSQPPVPISLQDAAVQTTPLCDVSGGSTQTQTSDQQHTLACDVAVQTSSHGAHILSFDRKGKACMIIISIRI